MVAHSTGAAPWYDGLKGYGNICAKDAEEVSAHDNAIAGFIAQLSLAGDRAGLFPDHTLRGPQTTDVTRQN